MLKGGQYLLWFTRTSRKGGDIMRKVMRFTSGWVVLVLFAAAAGADLLVASVNGDRILRFHEVTGAYLGDFVPARTGGLDEPQGMEYGPDGNLYVCSNDQHAILRFDGVTGAFIDAFVPPRSGGLNSPGDLEFGPDGNLYVSSYGTNAILRYDGRTGAFLDAFVPSGTGGLTTPAGITFGPDGNLYVTTWERAQVMRLDGRTGAFLGVFVQDPANLYPAIGVRFGPDGHLYVSGGLFHRVMKYHGVTGAPLGAFIPTASGGLNGAYGYEWGPDGHFYLASYGGNAVLRYNGTTGAFLGVFVAAGAGGLTQPGMILFTPRAVQGNVTLQEYDPTKVSQVPITVKVYQRGQLVRTATLTLDNNGNYTLPNVVPGTYDFAFKASHWLQVVVRDVNVPKEGITGLNVTLLNGDVDGDNEVSLQDFSALVAAFGSGPGSPSWNLDADLDGDEDVTLNDFSILLRNFGAVGDE